jgi:uncharacterized protein
MKSIITAVTLLLTIMFSSVALALSLDDAKAQGMVGEKLDGYVAAVTASPSADVQAVVSSTNDGRRKVYADLATRNKLSIDAVAVLSAEKLHANAGSGTYLQNQAGQWVKKP